jgi:hypothetical protein
MGMLFAPFAVEQQHLLLFYLLFARSRLSASKSQNLSLWVRYGGRGD